MHCEAAEALSYMMQVCKPGACLAGICENPCTRRQSEKALVFLCAPVYILECGWRMISLERVFRFLICLDCVRYKETDRKKRQIQWQPPQMASVCNNSGQNSKAAQLVWGLFTPMFKLFCLVGLGGETIVTYHTTCQALGDSYGTRQHHV